MRLVIVYSAKKRNCEAGHAAPTIMSANGVSSFLTDGGWPMHVVLEVESGLKRGHKVWLRGRQSLSVGATELADFAIPGDPLISHVHFTLHSHQQGCRIADLESAHGTFVNAQPVEDCWLHDCDRLRAGRTLFSVRIESRDQRQDPEPRRVVRGLK